MTKHKWHDEIVAWAGGAEIEINDGPTGWRLVDKPSWHTVSSVEYRIKPQPKQPKYLYVHIDANGNPYLKTDLFNGSQFIGKIKVQDE
jgi:hypothetical protein